MPEKNLDKAELAGFADHEYPAMPITTDQKRHGRDDAIYEDRLFALERGGRFLYYFSSPRGLLFTGDSPSRVQW